jgi:hypothetical protein
LKTASARLAACLIQRAIIRGAWDRVVFGAISFSQSSMRGTKSGDFALAMAADTEDG